MAFKTVKTVNTQTSDDAPRETIDWEAYNKSVVEQVGLQERDVLVGVVAGIIDCGIQPQPDSQYEFTDGEEEKAKILAKNDGTYFQMAKNRNGEVVEMKCKPVRDCQSIVVVVDFPDIIVDRSEFFPDSKPAPLRMYLNREFWDAEAGQKIIQRPTPLRITNLDKSRKTKVWSLAVNSNLYKAALGAKIITPGEPFLPEQIDSLLGVSLQFNVQVFLKENNGKHYYTEYISLASGLSRGQKPLELPYKPFVIQFDDENDEEMLKQLRVSVVNTIKRAKNYEGSVIQKQLESVRQDSGKAASQKEKPSATNKPAPAKQEEPDDFDDESLPF